MAKKKVASDASEETVQAPVASEEVNPEVSQEPVAPQEPTASETVIEQPEVVAPVEPAHVPVGSKAEAMRQFLASQPKVRVFVPLAPGEKPGVTQSVILNGYSLFIRKGDYVEVPQQVAEVLEVKMKHKMSVENHPNRLGSDGKVQMDTYGS